MELSEAQVRELAERLRATRDELQATLRGTDERARPVVLDQAAVGRVSRVDAMQQQQMAAAQRRLAETRLAQIAAALKRVENGAYGDCIDCGESIGHARLQVRPEASLCVRCQGAREQ